MKKKKTKTQKPSAPASLEQESPGRGWTCSGSELESELQVPAPAGRSPRNSTLGVLAQLGMHICQCALFQQDQTLNLWLKCSGPGSFQANGDLPAYSSWVSVGPGFVCGQKMQPLAYMPSVLQFSYGRSFHLTHFINQQVLLWSHKGLSIQYKLEVSGIVRRSPTNHHKHFSFF